MTNKDIFIYSQLIHSSYTLCSQSWTWYNVTNNDELCSVHPDLQPPIFCTSIPCCLLAQWHVSCQTIIFFIICSIVHTVYPLELYQRSCYYIKMMIWTLHTMLKQSFLAVSTFHPYCPHTCPHVDKQVKRKTRHCPSIRQTTVAHWQVLW